MRATIYARISSDREGAGLGVQSQEADCRDLAASLGWNVVSVHTDNDVSAYSGKPRPGYRAMLEEIKAGEVDAVLAWHTDRLHRSVTELEEYATLCDAHTVTTHTVKAGHIDLATPSGRLVARQLGSVARYEVEHMVERQRRAKLRSASAGKWKGGRRPFGYASDGIQIIEAEAAVIREAAGSVLAGESLRGVSCRWNAAGLVTSTGGPWDGMKLRRVLLRPRNAGLMEHLGEIVGPAEWAPVLPEEQWRAVAAVLTGHEPHHHHGKRPEMARVRSVPLRCVWRDCRRNPREQAPLLPVQGWSRDPHARGRGRLRQSGHRCPVAAPGRGAPARGRRSIRRRYSGA